MKKEIRYLIGIAIGIVCTIVCLVIMGTTNNQKKCELDTTTETTSQKIIEPTEITEELTIEETTTDELTESTTRKSTDYVDCDVPSNNTIKTYMDYRTITSTDSRQYKLQESLAYTDGNGLRMVNGRYCVAVGSYYTTTIGQHIDIVLEDGSVIPGIVADCKADIHTDSTNRINPNGCVVEFIVDTESLDETAKTMGDISYINGWNSKVVNIRVYDKVEIF